MTPEAGRWAELRRSWNVYAATDDFVRAAYALNRMYVVDSLAIWFGYPVGKTQYVEAPPGMLKW